MSRFFRLVQSLWVPAFAGMTVACTQPIPPNGIVSNNPCIDSILAEIAAPGQIAAISHYSHGAESGSAPLDWARAIPAIGDTAEEIIAARPRLVLTGNLASSGTNAALAKAGIKMVTMGVPATLAENDAQIRMIAKAIGRAAAGERLIGSISPGTGVADSIAGGKPGTAPTALIWQTGGFVAGAGTLQDELLARAGYINAASLYGLKQWDILPLETLLRAPPDVIFMPHSGGGDDGRALERRYSVLRHVRNIRIVEFPDKLLFCGGPTVAKVMAVLR
ncbi:MAG: ABC transporter substrate-binding protein [Sphingomonadaceae bacterium]